MKPILTEMFLHHAWANLAIADFCATLDDSKLEAGAAGTYGAIGPTLLHLAAAEARYVAALNGDPAKASLNESQPFPGHVAVRASLRQSGDSLIALASEEVDRMIPGDHHGDPFSIPLSIFIIQAIDHGKEHRTHIAAALTGLGMEPPTLDGWRYAERPGANNA